MGECGDQQKFRQSDRAGRTGRVFQGQERTPANGKAVIRLELSEVKEALVCAGSEVVGNSPEQVGAFMRRETERSAR